MINSPPAELRILSKRLWGHINSKRRIQIGLLFLLMIVASALEIVSIGAIIPFLAVLTNPATLFENALVRPLVEFFGFEQPSQLVLPLAISFSLAALLSGFTRLALLWGQTRLGHAIGADLSTEIYRRVLYQPYSRHLSLNTSEVIATVSTKANAIVYAVVLPLLQFTSSLLITIAIMATLLAMEPKVAISAFAGFASIYAAVIFFTRKRVAIDSRLVSREQNQVVKALQEGLGGIRDVLLDGTQEVFCKIFTDADRPLRRAQANIQIIGATPRYGIEALGMVLLAVLAYSFTKSDEDMLSLVPVLGAFALGAQRMLPALQQAYSAWSSIRGAAATVQDALELMDQPLPEFIEGGVVPIDFTQDIHLENVSFRFAPDGPWIIQDLTLQISKGSRVGLMGPTGSGKSTLVDLFLGLLQPTKGVLKIDGKVLGVTRQRAWQRHVTHVPQTIFLSDTSIAGNIAFGIVDSEIDMHRVKDAARRAQIADTIESWPEGYQTKVGERGVRLSGGQRQRIGIARALYRKVDVLVLDEATSALDQKTESAVMRSLDELNGQITVLIVAHRLSTLEKCDVIIEMVDGEIKQSGSYERVIGKKGARS